MVGTYASGVHTCVGGSLHTNRPSLQGSRGALRAGRFRVLSSGACQTPKDRETHIYGLRSSKRSAPQG
jgi:hypothetical protein